MVKARSIAAPKKGPFNIDLACGDNKRPDYFGIDKFKTTATDAVFDLLLFPWPIKAGTVDTINCSHFFEHIPARKRPPFMNECYRVLKAGAQMVVTVPDPDSHRAIQDFTHEYPPPCAESFLYFNKKWRTDNKLLHGDYAAINCNFDFSYGFNLDPDVTLRSAEWQQFAIKHYRNHSGDLQVTLTKR